jgi:hypothetical protein
LTVAPEQPDGTNPVELRAHGLPEGSRWRISFEGDDSFTRTAVDGTWSVTTDAMSDDGTVFAYAEQLGRGEDGVCLVINSPTAPTGGATGCGRGIEALTARELDDGSTVIRFFILEVRDDTRWQLDLRVSEPDSEQRFAFDSTTNRRGTLRARVELSDPLTSPVFTMNAVSGNDLHCRIALDPGMVTAAPQSSPGALAHQAERLRG